MRLAGLLARLPDAQRRGAGQWWARCPCHEERTASLSLREDAHGVAMAHCFGCGAGTREVCAALGLVSDAPPVYVRPPVDDAEAARRDVLAQAKAQAWSDPHTRVLVAGSDAYRRSGETIRRLQDAATRLGPDDPASWRLEARAARLQAERRLLEMALDRMP